MLQHKNLQKQKPVRFDTTTKEQNFHVLLSEKHLEHLTNGNVVYVLVVQAQHYALWAVFLVPTIYIVLYYNCHGLSLEKNIKLQV